MSKIEKITNISSQGEIFHIIMKEDKQGARIDRILAEELPELSRSYLQTLIKNGHATFRGKPVKSSFKPNAGDEIELLVPPPTELDVKPEKMDLDILYEDQDVLIVNKPKDMTVHPAPGSPDHTLVNGILYHCQGELSGINGVLRPGIVHRIDKNTTGALIVCKNDHAHRVIAEQLKVHSITRKYRAIVYGNIKEDTGSVTGNIGRSTKDRKKMAVVREGGKPATTHFRVLERFGQYTYCEFTLETGRTHQIRVHMASIGHPILGDDVYGPKTCPFHLEGQTLHAMVIGFIHPSTGQYVEFTAPLPEYFETLLRKLEHGRSTGA